MAEGWVCNASPLILFKRINRLELLKKLCVPLILPQGVLNEVNTTPEEAQHWTVFSKSVEVVKIKKMTPIISGWDLGRGESEVISWAFHHPGLEVILDDLAARKCARSLEIPVRGSVGLMLLAKSRGLVPAARPLIEDLIQAGMWFDKKWITQALELIGE